MIPNRPEYKTPEARTEWLRLVLGTPDVEAPGGDVARLVNLKAQALRLLHEWTVTGAISRKQFLSVISRIEGRAYSEGQDDALEDSHS